jgi:hypothetical protein
VWSNGACPRRKSWRICGPSDGTAMTRDAVTDALNAAEALLAATDDASPEGV